MEKDFIKYMFCGTFVIIILFAISKLFTTNKLPFHIERTFKVDVDNKKVAVDHLTFNKIPATIYQLYNNNTKITYKLIDTINNNISNSNEFEYYFINDDDARLFIEQQYEPKLLNIYDNLNIIDKNNLFKYCLLYKNGGIYMDINLELKEKILNIISPIFKLSPTKNTIIFTKDTTYISNKLIITEPGLPIFKELIDSYINNNIVTLTNLIDTYGYNNNIYLYVDDDNYIKNINNDKICFSIK